MKYCSKCGKELLDEAVICPNCGCPIEDKTIKEFIDENKRTTAKKNLYTGLLLNIFSVVIPIVLIIIRAEKLPKNEIYHKRGWLSRVPQDYSHYCHII